MAKRKAKELLVTAKYYASGPAEVGISFGDKMVGHYDTWEYTVDAEFGRRLFSGVCGRAKLYKVIVQEVTDAQD